MREKVGSYRKSGLSKNYNQDILLDSIFNKQEKENKCTSELEVSVFFCVCSYFGVMIMLRS